MNLINDTLNIVLKYSHNKNCILVCKLWHDIISQNSIKCKYCNKFTKIYDDIMPECVICNSPFDAIITTTVKGLKSICNTLHINTLYETPIKIECMQDKIKFKDKRFMYYEKTLSDKDIGILHKHKINNNCPSIIGGYFSFKQICRELVYCDDRIPIILYILNKVEMIITFQDIKLTLPNIRKIDF
jgi:hypothetical protein